MIEFVMNYTGTRAHIKDRHVTWCGGPGNDIGYIPKGTRICPMCWDTVLAEGIYTEEQLLSAQEILENGK